MNHDLTCYGRHINAARWDPLDIACVRQAARLLRQQPADADRPLAVDLGSEHGTMALTLRDIGYRVIAVDRRMPLLIKQTLGTDAIERDMTRIGWARLPAPTICYSQRTLHYLPFDAAAQLLATLGRRTGARVFVSLAGADSELAYNYPHADRPVRERFCRPDPPVGDRYFISAPLCLYTEADAALLIDAAGLRLTDIWTCHFGTVKISAVRLRPHFVTPLPGAL